ncbi:MAG: hypothetical protein M1831_005335 [Alyxoria varia]|nr:MAG: hypothetical protein M1831_005335 [Alyxoria varia]
MSVRVVARIRPLLKDELDKDVIVKADPADSSSSTPRIVRIPNPKNQVETFSFQFNNVYGQESTQQNLFENEVSPTVKHLFGGYDVTLFAYGVTGTGKTHTMRGGKTLHERGLIPRLLSSIFRKGRKIEKDNPGTKEIEVSMSYYEIYNDKVYDLLEPPEKRTAAGLPIRDNGGKTIVAGLTERPCTTLKDFELLYDQGNINRSTSATKLNAHSSRSHAILCVKLSQISEDHTIVSRASAIDLAGSEDNRRTENGKDRLVESSSINKSLFVLAQCVEAISKKQARIPYRESKMTRILSLGQNNGLTIMILNLAPVRSFHLDTLSSLTVANRTRKIEVREVENEPIYRGLGKQTQPVNGPSIQRQPLRPIPSAANAALNSMSVAKNKPAKAFSVYEEKKRQSRSLESKQALPLKRSSENAQTTRPFKPGVRPNERRTGLQPPMAHVGSDVSKANLEELVNRMVDEKLANKALQSSIATESKPQALSEELQRRLEALENRVESQEDERSEGLEYLMMAKQHQVRGESASALKMYRLALPFFPENDKLSQRIVMLEEKLSRSEKCSLSGGGGGGRGSAEQTYRGHSDSSFGHKRQQHNKQKRKKDYEDDDVSGSEYHEEHGADATNYQNDSEEDDDFQPRRKDAKPQNRKRLKVDVYQDHSDAFEEMVSTRLVTPRTQHLLDVINTRDANEIRKLKGVGKKKAEVIVNAVCEMDEEGFQDMAVSDLRRLGKMKGVGVKVLEKMRSG